MSLFELSALMCVLPLHFGASFPLCLGASFPCTSVRPLPIPFLPARDPALFPSPWPPWLIPCASSLSSCLSVSFCLGLFVWCLTGLLDWARVRYKVCSRSHSSRRLCVIGMPLCSFPSLRAPLPFFSCSPLASALFLFGDSWS